ncbi:DNA polymerase [Crane-associated adenovirus 1]|uniref:DNA polymerase n=1 Tax=Crane-associated adenovirus 1 TaxID=2559941 RepID=A0A5H2WX18_9ADEN|nr:DNA polymerase [Crane-associated adenovirus 1]
MLRLNTEDIKKFGNNISKVKTVQNENVLDIKRDFKSTGKSSKHKVYYLNGDPYRFYINTFAKGMKHYLTKHKFLKNNRLNQYYYIDYKYYSKNPVENLLDVEPRAIKILKLKSSKAEIQTVKENANAPLPPILLYKDNISDQWMWVTSYLPVKKCPRCGDVWVNTHHCNLSRSAFYWHAVSHKGRQFWQHVPFKCVSSLETTKRVFITYDIETYTRHDDYGKRMHPFMLCFSISGDEDLKKQIEDIASNQDNIIKFEKGYFWIDKEPGKIGKYFKKFRTEIQTFIAKDLLERYCKENQEYVSQILNEGCYRSIYQIPLEAFTHPSQPLKISDQFYSVEVVIVGHNISGFDEILLAVNIIDMSKDLPEAVKPKRMFMPRQGKLLFNDITFSLPNPNFKKKDQSRAERWAKGRLEIHDVKQVCANFYVRDTYQLTMVKLEKAAPAYNLDISKGHCPFAAINDLYAKGAFEKDSMGFPALKYWKDEKTCIEQKKLWIERHPGKMYNLIRACLEYCMLDVKVTEALVHKLMTNYELYYKESLGMEGKYNIFQRPTIPSNSTAFWKQLIFKQHFENEASKSKKVDPKWLANIYSPTKVMFQHIRQALRGGRCYPTVLGPYNKPVYVFDICGMYASALTHPMPNGMPLDPDSTQEYIVSLNKILQNEKQISYFDDRIKPCIIKVNAYPPPLELLDNLPPVCSRKGGRLVWTNEPLKSEILTIVDIVTLVNRGWDVEALADSLNIVFPQWGTICSEYVSKNIAAKEKADINGNAVMRSIAKMLSNSLYGAFATNMDTSKTYFENMMDEKELEEISNGNVIVKQITLLGHESVSVEEEKHLNSAFGAIRLEKEFNPLLSESDDENIDEYSDESNSKLTEEIILSLVEDELEDIRSSSSQQGYIYPHDEENHTHHAPVNDTVWKMTKLAEVTGEAVTIINTERQDGIVENNKYATQIACFVLGWSRAFFSDWCEIVHGPDRGIPLEDREAQSLYGDTDSLFLTESGYRRMLERGAHRIKSKSTKLIYDPNKPDLYWACECDIKCTKCKGDTYAPNSIFLAPKLYALKTSKCNKCGYEGEGKLRAKGHNKEELKYDTLLKCWNRYEDEKYAGNSIIPQQASSRNIFKKTIINKVSKYDPFTINEERLTRVLRPWNDMTLYENNGFLYPYDIAHPNPRTANIQYPIEVPGYEDYALQNFDIEDADEVLEALNKHEFE